MVKRIKSVEPIFQQGDVVQLRSGGPWVTVISPQESGVRSGDVRVTWFDSTLALHDAVVPQDCLKLMRARAADYEQPAPGKADENGQPIPNT